MIEEYFNQMKEPQIVLNVYTDGACSNNGKCTAKAGIGIYCSLFEISEPFIYENPTNNRAELYAILLAIIKVKEIYKKYEIINIFTDSEYSLKSCTEWKEKDIIKPRKKERKNQELIDKIYDLLQKYPRINLNYIRAHTGYQDEHSLGNEKADSLAVQGINKF